MKNPATEPQIKKKMAVWKKVLIGIGVFIVLIIILAMWATSGLTEVAQKQLNLIKSGDMKNAYDLTSQDFKKTTSYDGFLNFVNSYPSLKNNESSSFSDRQVEGNTGTLKGELKAKDGAVTPIEYQFVKENGDWKILAITLNATGAGVNVSGNSNNNSSPVPSSSNASTQPVAQNNQNSNPAVADVPLGKTFADDGLGYSIDYPADWVQERPDNVTVLFSGPAGKTGSPTVNIQNIASKANANKGGKYASIDEMVQDLKGQFLSMDKKAAFSEIKESDFPMVYGKTMLKGKVFGAEYTYQGVLIKQIQYCIARNDGLIFYSWAFTVPKADFDQYQNTATSILASWRIK